MLIAPGSSGLAVAQVSIHLCCTEETHVTSVLGCGQSTNDGTALSAGAFETLRTVSSIMISNLSGSFV